jgi:predicted alpha/beta superfamily hydrolase
VNCRSALVLGLLLNASLSVACNDGTTVGDPAAVQTADAAITTSDTDAALAPVASDAGLANTDAVADSGAAVDAARADAGPTRTTVRVHYPRGTHSLALRGAAAPLSWTQNATATPAADGWTWSSDNLTTASDFKPLLDQVTWSIGANYRVSPGESIDIYPRFTSTVGSYSVRWPSFGSPSLGRARKVWVYLPPGYSENTEARYPVVYMHDGQNLFDRNAPFGFWHVDEALDQGAADGSIREAIVVGPEATSSRMTDYTPSFDASEGAGGGAAAYLTSLVTELKPLVDRELRTKTGREDTAMIGSSLGGLVTAWASVHHASTFGLCGAMSPSTWWDNTMILSEVSTLAAQSTKPLRIYVDSGDSGPSLDDNANTALLAGRYRTSGYVDGRDLLYVLARGARHNESYWAERLPGALRFLVGPRPHTGAMP